ncbi:MAG: DUF87 domain-containing protein [Oscillospiraceae bacterium]|nr:DUF87 domain-containing protein [Oscillospiraceae bacterium]
MAIRNEGYDAQRENENHAIQQVNANIASAKSLDKLNQDISAVYNFLNHRHIEELENCDVKKYQKAASNISMYKINKIMYNEKEDSYEKLTNVFSALHSFVSGVTMIIKSDGKEIGLYLCTSDSNKDKETAGRLLASNIKGQFSGSEIIKVDNILEDMCQAKIIKSVSIIPGKRNEETHRQRDFSAQGFEKLIDSLIGKKYTLFVVSQKVPSDIIEDYKNGLENISTLLSPYAKESASYAYNSSQTVGYNYSDNFSEGVNDSISKSFGTSHTNGVSSGESINHGSSFNFFGFGTNKGRSTNTGESVQNGVNRNEATVSGTVFSVGSSKGESNSKTEGETHTLNVARDNKAVVSLMEAIDKHLKRIEENRVFGMWKCSCYISADDDETADISSNTLKSLLLGDDTISAEAYCNKWTDEQNKTKEILDYIKYLQHPQFNYTYALKPDSRANEQTINKIMDQIVTPALMISGKELPTIMSLPRKSVPGVAVSEMAEFARNVPIEWLQRTKRRIEFGNVYHMGQNDIMPVQLDVDAFASHCFITGTSGSGKSNTTYNILKNLNDKNVKFLVIEPAKGEYKKVFGAYPGMKVNVFTTTPKHCRMLRINPFEFHEKVHILEHINRLTNTISACWPLYGPMPAMLKQAFEKAYINCGWDLNHSSKIAGGGKTFPDFYDLEAVMTQILDSSEYSAQAKGDYKGALLTRISSMTSGFEGQIFCGNRGVSDKELFDANCVVDLSNIGSKETKALIMGVLIIRLREYRYATTTDTNVPTRHVTILEEAHNILKRCSHEQSQDSGNIMGSSVEMLTECIAEMRTYGEGFIIIDQSPGAVDITAIKNTAIKIIHKLPEKQDCEEIGNALSLKEEQIRELSRLETGVAAVFHAGWTDALLAKMGKMWDGSHDKNIIEVNKKELLKMRGEIIQLMYERYKNEILNTDSQTAIDQLLNKICAQSEYQTLRDGKIDEIKSEISNFFACNPDIGDEADATKRLFFGFAINFLQARDLFRIFPPPKFEKAEALKNAPITGKRAVAAALAEDKNLKDYVREIRNSLSNYLILPANDHFKEICAEIICEYGKMSAANEAHFESWEVLGGKMLSGENKSDVVHYIQAILK